MYNAQERQNIAPVKAEGLPDPCIDFSKECHFSDFIKIWLFLKITSPVFSNLLPQPVSVSICKMISFHLQLSLKSGYLFMLHCYDTDKKAELGSDSFADCGKPPTAVRGHGNQSASLTISICNAYQSHVISENKC